MENVYGIGTANRYALFLDEDADPLDILKQSEAEKLTAKAKKIEDASKPVNKTTAKKDASNNKNDADKENQRNNAGGRFEGKRVLDARKAVGGEVREERNNMRNTDGAQQVRRDDDGEGRGRGRGRGRGESRGRGRGGEGGGRGRMEGGGRGGKRDFDRKSGDSRTGIKAEDKRGGGGKGNWGTFEDDVPKEGEEAANTSVDAETSGDNEEVKEAPVEVAVKVPRELTEEEIAAKLAREEEEKQMTLDEWKAMQAKKEGPKFNLRKAGEGSDVDPKWKKATIYKKENEEEDDEEEEETVVYLQRSTRQKKLDINFTFADQGSSRGDGRGRGRGRGDGRGRGGGRGRGEGGEGRPYERRERREGEEGGDRERRPPREPREPRDGEGAPPRRGGGDGRGRGRGEGRSRGEGRGAGARGGPRGGQRGGGEFSLDQEAFPTLG